MTTMRGTVGHLARRFVGSYRSLEPTPDDRDWVRQQLTPPEFALFDKMTGNDQVHGIEVARHTLATGPVGQSDPSWLAAAALLHDVGKVDARAGSVGRAAATVLEPFMPAQLVGRLAAAPGWFGRVGRHIRYPEVGASMLSLVGSHEHVRSLAAQHHEPVNRWTIPIELGHRLTAADRAAT